MLRMINYKVYYNDSHYCDECGAKSTMYRIMCIQSGAFLCASCLKKFSLYLRMTFVSTFPHGSKWPLDRLEFERYLNPASVTGGSFDPKNITKNLFDTMDVEMEDLKRLMDEKKMIIKTLRHFVADYAAFKKAFLEFMNQ